MQILAVDLDNVKSYEKTKVEFLPGVNAIVGHNGAGKSTLLEAIGFALFDSLEYTQTEFMRAGAKSATVIVTFVSSFDDRPYEVHRRIGSGATYYIFDPQLDMRVCEGKADVQRFLRLHLGVEEGTDLKALFRDAVGVPQGLLTSAFLQSERERAPIFDSLLKLRDYDRAWDKLRDSINWLRSERFAVQNDISGLEGRLERLPVLKAQVAEREATLAATEHDLTAADAELCQVQDRCNELERIHSELAALQARLVQTAQRRVEVESRLASAKQQEVEAEEATRIVAECAADADRYEAAKTAKDALEEQLRRRAQIDARRMAADKAVALGESQLAAVHKELDAVTQAEAAAGTLAPAVAEQTRLEEAVAEARQQQARLEDARRAVVQAQGQVERLHTQLANLEKTLERAGAVAEEQASVEDAMGSLRAEIEQCRDAMSRHETQADALKEQTKQLSSVETALCPVCEQPLTADHRSGMVERNNKRLEAMRVEYKKLKDAKKTHEAALAEQETRAKELHAELLSLPRAQERELVASELRHSQESLAAAQAQVTQLSAATGLVESLVKQLDGLGDPRSRYAVAAGQAHRRAALERQQGELARQADIERAALAQAEAALAEFAGLDEQLEGVSAEAQRYEAAHRAVVENRRLAATLPERQTAVAAFANDLALAAAEVERLEAEQRTVTARYDAAQHAQLKARVDDLRGSIGGLRRQLAYLQDEQGRELAEIENLQEMERALAEHQARRDKMADQEHVLEVVRATLREAGPYMRAVLIRQISDGAHQIFGEIMQDYSRRLAWNDDYGITLEVDGHMRQFALLSGGEQMAAALSVRLALLREMSAINVAFFDEPTANLDETRREALARQILAVRGFQQIFVISHDDTFEQATQNLIRVERHNGVSRVAVDANRA